MLAESVVAVGAGALGLGGDLLLHVARHRLVGEETRGVQAAALGESHAFRELSTMYLKGEGVEVDLVRARLLYLQSVALGSEPVAAVEQVLNENMSEAQMAESDRAFTQWQQQREQP